MLAAPKYLCFKHVNICEMFLLESFETANESRGLGGLRSQVEPRLLFLRRKPDEDVWESRLGRRVWGLGLCVCVCGEV